MDWQDAQDSRCPGCGRYRDECMDPDAEGSYKVTAWRCFACTARGEAVQSFGQSGTAEGVFFAVEREEVNPDG